MTRTHGGPTVAILAVAGLGLEALGLAGGTTSAVIVTVFIAAACVLAVVQVPLATLGVMSTVALAFFTSWNGWRLGPIQPGDLLIFVSFACFVAANNRSRVATVPWWITQAAAAIALVGILHMVLPTDPSYLATRTVVDAAGQPFVEFQTNVGVMIKFIVAIALLPLCFVYAVMHDRRSLYWIAASYSAGTGLSGLVAFTDGRGLTHLALTVTGVYFSPDREGGFSNHANFLATAVVLAVPLALWLTVHPLRYLRFLGYFSVPSLLVGVYATGSRGGTVASVFAAALALALLPRLRPYLPTIGFGIGLAAAAAFVASPALGQALLRATRLGGGTTATSGSDYVRALVGHQGILDLRHSPIDGIGLSVAAQAQNVYIQELAAGGVILFVAMLIFVLGSMRASLELLRYDDLARALFAAVAASALLNFAEANLTDRYYYVPAGLIAALVHLRRHDPVPAGGPDVPVAGPSGPQSIASTDTRPLAVVA